VIVPNVIADGQPSRELEAWHFTAQDYLMCTPEMARAMIKR
jgi:hypothetical protein